MTIPKHLKLFVVALAALAVGGGCGDPVDPAGDMVPAGVVVPEEATYGVPPIGQREVLDSVYSKTGGDNWDDNTNWLTKAPLGAWYGVSVDAQGNVVGLNLGDNGLTGSIPAELGDLRLTELDLSASDLTGPIPAELGDLRGLTELDLSTSDLTGPVPAELGDLDSLTDLRLHGNSGLRGPLPNELTGTPLNTFQWYDTGLCAPTDAVFQAWLDSISDEQGALDCGDRWVLHLFYGDTDGENWNDNTNWLTGAPLDDWYGVSADAQGNVTQLNLVNNDLTGPVPAELGDLESLTKLHLPSNNLTGSIPAKLGDLESLTKLHFGGNDLTGSIPAELGNLDSLTQFHLYNNNLTGSIPAELGNLESLIQFHLASNDLTGSIPAELGNLDSLDYIHLSGNDLTGSIPAELGDLENLTILSLYNNNLTGSIPAELGNLESLTQLYVHGNSGLRGPLPNDLTGTDLNTFQWFGTGLCAPTDATFQQWLDSISGELGALDCGDRWVLHLFYGDTDGENWDDNTNWLTDEPLGDWYGVSADALGNVTRLDLFNNALTGPVPAELGDLESLTELSLFLNGLTGPVPPELGNLESLTELYLSFNDLTGSIPVELGNLESLTELSLSSNDLTGSIPPELGNLDSLTWLDLHGNALTGSIPPELGNLDSLEDLSLSSNDFTGSIPPELGNLDSLTYLTLSSNDFTGSIPPELGNLDSLTSLWLYGNSGLTGPLPNDLIGTPLNMFLWHDTGLCAPTDASFQAWLASIPIVLGAGDCS